MLDTDQEPAPSEPDVLPSQRVDLPQTYRSWRDYAFSEFPEDERK